MKKRYANRDIIKQGQAYLDHVSAMTGEGLHHKTAIAAELAHRDIEIQRLRQALELIKARVSGEASPNWDFGNATYHSRGLIADWCDAVLSDND